MVTQTIRRSDVYPGVMSVYELIYLDLCDKKLNGVDK